MTDDQINAAIAKACGWTDIIEHQEFGLMGVEPQTHGCRTGIDCYTHCLNAMHEAEKDLLISKFPTYVKNLIKLNFGDPITAGARQRAEAFLRTLGKWEEAVVKEFFTTEQEVQG